MTKRVLLYFALLLWFVVPVSAQPTIFVESVEVESTETISLSVKVIDFTDVVSFQFSMNWDSAFLQFDGLSINEDDILPMYGASNFNTGNASQGVLVTNWVDPALSGFSVTDSVAFFNIQFTVLGAMGDSTSVDITETPAIIEFSGIDGNILTPIVENGTVIVSTPNSINDLRIQSNDAFALFQNEPNPFDTETIIKFMINEPSEYTLEVYDIKGTIVFSDQAHYTQGEHSLIIHHEMLPATGTYFYKLKTKDYFITNRMILVR